MFFFGSGSDNEADARYLRSVREANAGEWIDPDSGIAPWPPSDIVDPLVQTEEVTIVQQSSSERFSFLGIQLAHAIATGDDCWELFTSQRGPIMIVPSDVERRFREPMYADPVFSCCENVVTESFAYVRQIPEDRSPASVVFNASESGEGSEKSVVIVLGLNEFLRGQEPENESDAIAEQIKLLSKMPEQRDFAIIVALQGNIADPEFNGTHSSLGGSFAEMSERFQMTRISRFRAPDMPLVKQTMCQLAGESEHVPLMAEASSVLVDECDDPWDEFVAKTPAFWNPI